LARFSKVESERWKRLDTHLRYIYDEVAQRLFCDGKGLMNRPKDFITVRLDERLKDELHKAADVERRSLSNFSRLLIEHAWGQYLKAGSLHDLLASATDQPQPKARSYK